MEILYLICNTLIFQYFFSNFIIFLLAYLFHLINLLKIIFFQLWQADPALKNASALLYEEFLLNLDSLCQQETVGLLVGHVSSMTNGRNSETDLALGVLSKIAQTTPSVLVSYANFLRDALDHMELMSLERVGIGKCPKSNRLLQSMCFFCPCLYCKLVQIVPLLA